MMALSAIRPLLRVLAPINGVKEVLIQDLVLSSVTKNVVNKANSTDPAETPRFAASLLGLRYL